MTRRRLDRTVRRLDPAARSVLQLEPRVPRWRLGLLGRERKLVVIPCWIRGEMAAQLIPMIRVHIYRLGVGPSPHIRANQPKTQPMGPLTHSYTLTMPLCLLKLSLQTYKW
jgi:hypothetical protein